MPTARRRKRRPTPRQPTARRLAIRADQRRRVLAAAGRTLAAGGLAALNVRDLGAAAGASSTVVYTIFGGREPLLVAIYEEALEQLAAAMAKVSSPDPMRHLIELAHAYRRHAMAHPHLYAILLTTEPRIAATALRESRAMAILTAGVDRCVTTGVFAPGDPPAIADVMWAMIHGLVSLELAGYHRDETTATQRFFHAGYQLFSSFLAPKAAARR